MKTPGIAIVAGAASGVGAATVRQLAPQADAVIAIDLEWPADEVAPGNIVRVSGDVAAAGTWEEALEETESRGRLSMLVLNAGYLATGSVTSISEDEFRRVFEVNLFSAALGLRVTLPHLIDGGGGAIVGVASTNALFAEQGLAAYCASKGALLQLIRCVAVDFARQGIRANCVCPGAIDTPFFRRHVDAASDPATFLAEKIDRHPSGRILSPDDVASTICFLLSEAALGVNGAAVTIDGGLTATFDFQSTAVR